jgi:hypothetical protein
MGLSTSRIARLTTRARSRLKKLGLSYACDGHEPYERNPTRLPAYALVSTESAPFANELMLFPSAR